ncbi:MAG: DNA repair protein RadA [Oscillospiraceae bacterium]|nr:DNA repair protein RadA [Oscillospiraceae bacterium]
MKEKTVFFCSACGHETPRWLGQCPACGAWNTMTEAPAAPKAAAKTRPVRRSMPKRLSELDIRDDPRFSTGIRELDRVLGGGAVRGSIVLFGGAPGIGKSTLLLQACGTIAQQEKILYVTGEESERQIKMRAERLGVGHDSIYILAGTDINDIIAAIEEISPELVIVDSIQTIYDPALNTAPGSVGQVKQCAMEIMQLAKASGFTAFVVGHVNKEGAIAGPKVLEHMVDCVLYFEGDGSLSYRILRADKNRFGSTNEIGVFEMRREGLREVPDPSEVMLAGRPTGVPGTCVACVMEGSRPILAEVQALVTPTSFSVARRTSNGFDYNRLYLLLAVLEKRGGMRVNACDAYMNVVGGLTLDEPAADLAACLAIASSFRDMPVPDKLAAVGEVGLTGEIRSVQALDQRLSEIARLGFTQCVIPSRIRGELKKPEGMELIRVKTLREAVEKVL